MFELPSIGNFQITISRELAERRMVSGCELIWTKSKGLKMVGICRSPFFWNDEMRIDVLSFGQGCHDSGGIHLSFFAD